MENIQLGQWKVMGSLPYQADFSAFVTEGRLFNPATNLVPWIDATVPGSIYRDLERAGFIEDPYFDRNYGDVRFNCIFIRRFVLGEQLLKIYFGGWFIYTCIYCNTINYQYLTV